MFVPSANRVKEIREYQQIGLAEAKRIATKEEAIKQLVRLGLPREWTLFFRSLIETVM